MEEKRRQRSDTMELLLEANVTLFPPGGRSLSGRLMDVSAGEVSVLLVDSRKPPPAKGQRVRLQILLRKLDKPMNIVATVLSKRQEDDRTICTFRFTHMATVDRTLPPDIYSVFNRRQMFRVRPDPRRPIKATLVVVRDDDRRIEAEALITDISGSGVGVFVDGRDAAPFNLSGHLDLELSLPGHEQPLTFRGRICYRVEVGKRWRYGIEFDSRRTTDYQRKQQQLMTFIMNRQRDLLKMPTGRYTPA